MEARQLLDHGLGIALGEEHAPTLGHLAQAVNVGCHERLAHAHALDVGKRETLPVARHAHHV